MTQGKWRTAGKATTAKTIVVANALGRLGGGKFVYAFPSRWDGAWHTNGKRGWTHYPYELAYLSTLLKRELPEHQVKMIDGNHEGWAKQVYCDHIDDESPDVFVTEASSMTFEPMSWIARRLKRQRTVTTVLTGPLGTYDPKRALAAGWDHVVSGEYEHKVLAIIRGQDQPTSYIDLDSLPWPEDQDIHRIEYFDPHTAKVFPGHVQVFATRGCPLSCTFCAVPLYYGGHNKVSHSHRNRDPNDVCDEIEYLASRYEQRFTGCFFNEETHNANAGWLEQFCLTIIRRGLNRYTYDAMCGYWPFTEDLVALCARAGYKEFRIGIESLEESTGKAIHKKVVPAMVQRFLEWCRDQAIMVYGTFQCGAPGSTKEGDLRTIRQAKQWRRDGLMQYWQCSISTPQPGTPFYAQAKEEGWLISDDLARYNGVEPVVSYPHYQASDIYAAFQESR